VRCRPLLFVVLLALCEQANAAQAAKPVAQPAQPPPCCSVPEAAQPAVPDSRGTAEHPFVVDAIPVKTATDVAREDADRAARAAADYWAKRIGIWTLVLLFVQALALAIQAWALIRTVRSSDRTSRTQLRAYVFVRSHVLAPMFVGRPLTATLAVRNYGPTPARRLRINAGMYLGNVFPEHGIQDVPTPQVGTLAPNALYEFSVTQEGALTEEQVREMSTGALKLFVFGTIYYTDAFRVERFTKFRLMTGGGIDGANWNQLYSAPQGNETDEPD
jgi:hypothetical protein